MDRARLVSLFRNWSSIEAPANLSPLYALLGNAVAEDPDLLDLASRARPGQPPPNVFFAAIHAELRRHPDHPLAAYYRTLGGNRPADSGAVEHLRDFALAHRQDLLPVIGSRLVQTNEVRRSAVLLPAFAEIARLEGRPLALFEIGPSAGLNLLFDRYRYRYGAVEYGPPDSPVLLETEPRGQAPALAMPRVVSRLGIDINPLDVSSDDDIAWLEALLWPEHLDRLALMEAALSVARREPPKLLRGDLFELLPPRVSGTPAGAAVTIFATFVLNQFDAEMLSRLRVMLESLAAARTLYLVVMGFTEFIEPGTRWEGDARVWILRLGNGTAAYRLSSTANPHGRWISWEPGAEWLPWRPAY